MVIREYKERDCREMAELFYNTVHAVNARDYTKEQLNAWASGNINMDAWNRSFLKNYTLVALENDTLIGFGDIDNTGYLDHLFVHRDFQRQGVATLLCDRLETHFPVSTVTTHASITARPFFESRGYRVLYEQQVTRNGVILANYVMEK
ncbi:GNAT family N-acetyltransferase [Anaerocolumna xylanovorans]|uniref:Putative acetyltransferase n=1 Tax=Anaerocolumna xylanovorans DSM 12503 TaxID=1121345 RepID=A0A1M7YHC9_9FIRM|nr:GNAT family N-acetyltransferase [Anaerocolumna xylanovorans]SHO52054.1 putative acetyltransferase [Anaerocolumna xylanovorans DSM 12503]